MSKTKARSKYASENLRTPSRRGLRLTRGGFGAILSLLIPPLGLLFLWRQGVFRIRGRLLLTLVSTVEMALVQALVAGPSATHSP